MNSWNEDDLRAITESNDLYISSFREDGITYGTPTLVWLVRPASASYFPWACGWARFRAR